MTVQLALDASGDVASLAARGADGGIRTAEIIGTRQHAGGMLPQIDALLAPSGGLEALELIIVANGPGGFTGIRVAAAIAKALHLSRGTPVWTGTSLAARAVRHAPTNGGTVLVASNALRSEAYAAVYEVRGRKLLTVAEPRTMPVTALPELARGVSVMVLDLPELPALAELRAQNDIVRIDPPGAGATAEGLLTLLALEDGAVRLDDVAAWEPVYGRPVEAQTRWEEVHGRPLPHPLRTSG